MGNLNPPAPRPQCELDPCLRLGRNTPRIPILGGTGAGFHYPGRPDFGKPWLLPRTLNSSKCLASPSVPFKFSVQHWESGF